MKECKWREFVEDTDGRGSAARLNMVMGVLIGSFAVIWLTVEGNLGGEIFATFMLATGGVYGFGKWRESVKDIEQIKADSPYPPVDPAPTQPATVIQVGQQPSSDVKAKDVAIKAEGNVNIAKSKPTRRRRR